MNKLHKDIDNSSTEEQPSSLLDIARPRENIRIIPDVVVLIETEYYPRYHYYTNNNPIYTISDSPMEEYVKISNIQDWKLRQALPLRLATVFNYLVLEFSNDMFKRALNRTFPLIENTIWGLLLALGILIPLLILNILIIVWGIKAYLARYRLNRKAGFSWPMWQAIWYYIRRFIKCFIADCVTVAIISRIDTYSYLNYTLFASLIGLLIVAMTGYRILCLDRDKKEDALAHKLTTHRTAGYRINSRIYWINVIHGGVIALFGVSSLCVHWTTSSEQPGQ
ncbi:hypothetical protein NEHOM01_0289 [Nematocida homosporus]|uniref:uncharacterized protein n=1 Tax=Nematocida homosporus TaxID=1912981 RepID=UPI00221E6FB0|nr:uncharacterized protein NEHOM01_0289 [Nematocida homosporus]KAI5184614.1 hypothetical protein NEHOM01_0289 [Nematocida homosporus]